MTLPVVQKIIVGFVFVTAGYFLRADRISVRIPRKRNIRRLYEISLCALFGKPQELVVIADDIRIFSRSLTAAVFVKNTVELCTLAELAFNAAVIFDSAEISVLLFGGVAVGTAENAVINIVLIVHHGQCQFCESRHIQSCLVFQRFCIQIAAVNGNCDICSTLPLCVKVAVLGNIEVLHTDGRVFKVPAGNYLAVLCHAEIIEHIQR